MLRSMLGEPPRTPDGALKAAFAAMGEFTELCDRLSRRNPEIAGKLRTYAVWAEGLRRSLDELEESLFAAEFFGNRVPRVSWEKLTDADRLNYGRHVYFDKNAYIRIFSLLDKMGTLMNDLLELKTEKVKPRFSYFTVLRRLRETGRHAELAAMLTALKEEHRDAMSRLRRRRNTEIHYMNAELKDDLQTSERMGSGNGEPWHLENLPGNMADAREGWAMVLGTVERVFAFACGRMRRLP
ncbi:Cthe_2314 family HEPN domain-containing protein [Cohnella caldifontis]|uniref:Cthe_2314 family HEPN domain-containing protein n=1 Tax=Cohnella caldifontis TaxID=3027471 RepID=UPI0023EDC450|nr:Cthe_2314 family HEPN domain-containing protein [Cohnella sp. YIM B05605]